MDRTQELDAAAAAAGLHDPDMLKIARTDLPPAEAVRDLACRFPGAFEAPQPVQVEQPKQPKRFVPPRRFEAMTQAEREAFIRPARVVPSMQPATSPFRRG